MRLKEGTKIKLQGVIFQIWLQVVCCRLFANILKVVCRRFRGYLLFSSHGTVSYSYLGFLSHFHSISALRKVWPMQWPMEWPPNGWTSRWTDRHSYRDAWMRWFLLYFLHFLHIPIISIRCIIVLCIFICNSKEILIHNGKKKTTKGSVIRNSNINSSCKVWKRPGHLLGTIQIILDKNFVVKCDKETISSTQYKALFHPPQHFIPTEPYSESNGETESEWSLFQIKLKYINISLDKRQHSW